MLDLLLSPDLEKSTHEFLFYRKIPTNNLYAILPISKSKHLHILFLGFLIHPYFDFYNQNQSKSTSTYFGLFAAGLQVKLPLSRHQLGTYSYFIDKDEDQFNSVESLDEKFLSNQLTFLEGIKKNSIEQIVDKLAITQKISTENIIKYHKKILVGKREISLDEIREVFVLDEILSSIWLHIADGRLTSLERVVYYE